MRSSLCFLSVLRLLTTAQLGHAAASEDQKDGDNCDCFLTNGTEPGYYAQHMFFDFRNLTDYAGVPKGITNDSAAALAPPSSDYFKDDEWTSVWDIQTWSNSKGPGKGLSEDSTVLMVNSPNNIYIQENDDDDAASKTYMTMRTQRFAECQTAAEFQSTQSNYQYTSLRMLARTLGSPGAVTAMFTCKDCSDLDKVQEADLEILTRDPRHKIQYTNQPSYNDGDGDISEATRNASMPGDVLWTDWAVHRLDWTPERSVWYVNGEEVASIKFQVPRDASGINFNSWSNGGTWSGNMSVGGEASLQIQWIEMVYNTTTTGSERVEERSDVSRVRQSRRDLGPRGDLVRRKSAKGKCRVVCSIDETAGAGIATILWNSTATRAITSTTWLGSRMIWAWTVVLLACPAWLWLI